METGVPLDILLVEDEQAQACFTEELLRAAGHRVVTVPDAGQALGRVHVQPFDAIVCDWMLPDQEGTAVLRAVRASKSREPAHSIPPLLILTSVADSDAVRAHAVRCGAHAFLGKPHSAESLAAAIAGARAVREEERAGHPNGKAGRIASSTAWSAVPSSVAWSVSQCLGISIAPGAVHAVPPVPHRSLTTMIAVAEQCEVAAALYASGPSAAELGRLLVRNAAPDARLATELLDELGNNLLGVLKTSMRQHGFEFTLGLARRGELPAGEQVASGLAFVHRLSLTAPTLSLFAVIGGRGAPVVAVRPEHLSENMIVAADLYAARGGLLLRRGTRLTASQLARITRLLPGQKVRVCNLEAAGPGGRAT